MENRKEDIFEALLKISANEAFKQETEALPSSEELDKLYTPSHALDKKIRNIIGKNERTLKMRRTVRTLGRAAAVIGIFIAVGTTILMSVEASRNFILNTIIKAREDHVSFEFREGGADTAGYIYTLDYIPDGFALTGSQTSDNIAMYVYTNHDGDQIIFQQCDAMSASISIDNENTDYTTVVINQQDWYLFTSGDDNDYNALMLQSGNVVLELISSIDFNELIQVAENISKK